MWKMRKMKIDNILLFILLWLPIYQDSKLYNNIGSFGHAPIAIASIFIFIYCFFIKKIEMNKYFKQLYNLLGLIILISIFSTIYYVLKYNMDNFYNENLFLKVIKGSMYFIAIVCYIVSFITLTKDTPKIAILKQCRNIFIFLTLILIVEYFTLPNAFSFLHAIRPNNYYRIRLLTSESSWTTTIIIVYFVLSLAYCCEKKTKKQAFFVIFLFLLFIITTTSKSLMLLSLICFSLFSIYNLKKLTLNKILIILIFFVITFSIANKFINKLDDLFSYDIQNSTSISTRVYSMFCGFKMIINNPIGYGTAIYLPYLQEMYYENLNDFNQYEWFNQDEIVSLIYSQSDSSLSIKSGILQYTLYWGMLGTFIFYRFLYKIYKGLSKLKNCNSMEINLYKSSLITLIIFITFVSSFDYKYEIWTFIAYLIYLEIQNQKGEKKNDKVNSNVFTSIS